MNDIIGPMLAVFIFYLGALVARRTREGLPLVRITLPSLPRFALVRTDVDYSCNHLLHDGMCVYCGETFVQNEDIHIEKVGKDDIRQASFASIAPKGKLAYVSGSQVATFLYTEESEKLNVKASPNKANKLGKASVLKSNDSVILIKKLESPVAVGNTIKLGKKSTFEVVGIQINGKNVNSADNGDSVGIELSESASQFGQNSVNAFRI